MSASCASDTERDLDLERGNGALAERSVVWLWLVDVVDGAGEGCRLWLGLLDDDPWRCCGGLTLESEVLSTSIGELDRDKESEESSSVNGELGNTLVRNKAHSSGSLDLNL